MSACSSHRFAIAAAAVSVAACVLVLAPVARAQPVPPPPAPPSAASTAAPAPPPASPAATPSDAPATAPASAPPSSATQPPPAGYPPAPYPGAYPPPPQGYPPYPQGYPPNAQGYPPYPPPGYWPYPPGYRPPEPPPPDYARSGAYEPPKPEDPRPRVIEVDDDAKTPPAGYKLVERPRTVIAAVGAGIFVLGYIPAIYVGAIGDALNAASGSSRDEYWPLYIPLAGPFVTISTANAKGAGIFWLVMLGAVQAGGAATAIAGLALPPKKYFYRNDAGLKLTLSPMLSEKGPTGALIHGVF